MSIWQMFLRSLYMGFYYLFMVIVMVLTWPLIVLVILSPSGHLTKQEFAGYQVLKIVVWAATLTWIVWLVWRILMVYFVLQ